MKTSRTLALCLFGAGLGYYFACKLVFYLLDLLGFIK